MNIKYLIEGIVAFILGIILLVWFIRKPIKFKEDPKENIGADDYSQSEYLYKQWNYQGIIAFVTMIILGIIFIYKGITGE